MLMDHTAKILYFRTSITIAVPYQTDTNRLFEGIENLFPFFIMIGRLAFPIFCFLLVEGFVHTSNIKRYSIRLFLFALLSEIPYDLAFSKRFVDIHSQNVFFTLWIGLLVIAGLKKYWHSSLRSLPLSLMIIGSGVFVAEWLQTDYGGWIGVLLIVNFYLFRNRKLLKCLFGGLILLQNSVFGLLAFLFIYLYNGQRGRQLKYFFYWFYPVHLLVLVSIQQFLIVPYLLMFILNQ
ncbi:hypothetical protein BCR25_07855 [Enterococcus termitis]|uniref:Conjugal transfer protein TraX n=2 Tax=Enterococcus termitis TaxID=332950 RepID=A0A1E5GIJ3_9ENTE|nr:hypothetical protein BCR25_07855 [Enterococcus termitis]